MQKILGQCRGVIDTVHNLARLVKRDGRVVYVQRFRGGLVFKAHRLVHHSTLGWRVVKKKKEKGRTFFEVGQLCTAEPATGDPSQSAPA